MEERNREAHEVHNHFEAGANCQVFNGAISGAIFAMPGSTVNVQDAKGNGESRCAAVSGESGEVGEAGLASTLASVFYGNAAAASTFLESIRGAKPTQVTALVNQWVEERKISPLSSHRDLWSVLHEAGLYAPSESNWNQQVT